MAAWHYAILQYFSACFASAVVVVLHLMVLGLIGFAGIMQVHVRSRQRQRASAAQPCPVHAHSQHGCSATATLDAPRASTFADLDHFAMPDTTPAFPRSDFEKDSNDLEL